MIIRKKHIRETDIEETQTTEVEDPKVHIGRGGGNEIQLDDLRVSLNHATIDKIAGTYVLTDLNSAHGTYVNHIPVGVHQLANNDKIQIGFYTLLITISSPDAPVTILVEQTEAGALPEQEEKFEYLSKYKLSTGFFTKSTLTVFAVIVILSGAIAAIALGKKTLFAPGKVSKSHALFENRCSQCHAASWNGVSDESCKTCHDAPIHHENQLFTPPCAECHPEHREPLLLASIEDRSCTRCHANLRTTKASLTQFERGIRGFNKGHPEFAVTVRMDNQKGPTRVRLSDKFNVKDTAQVELNHKIHLKPDLRGPAGPEQLTCDSCHQIDGQGAYMLPIEYQKQCMKCHLLEFDRRFLKKVVPHDKPEVVHDFLVMLFTQYLLNHPEELEDKERLLTSEGAGSVRQWVGKQVEGTEKVLAEKICKECHILTGRSPGSQLPVIEKTAITQRWLPHSVFDHRTHIYLQLSCT
ncbi:MAG: FHA domain-containing protein, partial [Candidatus Tectomicrobia bacterium]|nr:FHA domain-containing protein [Candidatus Tectomicrobia bacterium]